MLLPCSTFARSSDLVPEPAKDGMAPQPPTSIHQGGHTIPSKSSELLLISITASHIPRYYPGSHYELPRISQYRRSVGLGSRQGVEWIDRRKPLPCQTPACAKRDDEYSGDDSATQGILGVLELGPLVSICDIPDRSHILTVNSDPLGSIVRGTSFLNPSSLLGGLAGMAMPRRVEASFDARVVVD